MSHRPTFLQTLFNQPSQKYAPATAAALAVTIPDGPISSSHTATTHGHGSRPTQRPTITFASQKLAALAPLSQASQDSPSSDADADSVQDMFFTPPLTPQNNPSEPSPFVPAQSASSVSSDQDDDLFSSPSASTSLTSFHSESTKPHRPPKKILSRPRSQGSNTSNNVSSDWSRGVRWLVPPDSIHKSQPSTASIIRSLDLVDVEYAQPLPKQKPSSSRRSKSTRTTSQRMSAVLEEEEDDDHPLPRRTRAASTLSRSTSARTVAIPSPLPVSAGGPPRSAYTSLTLPRAAYTPTKHRVSASVDITRSGLAQTTMATIAIAVRPRPATPAHLRDSLPSPLTFASHTPPPTKVGAREVLVQVWAVALDALDALIVDDRAARADALGFIPGRSFVGRAVETGWEVSSITRGDWVVGITEVRKCGALAEFIVIDRRRLHTAPRPSAQLTVEQLSLLPLAGVPAHRAVRTFSHLPRDARTLILHAHTGAGLLATQQLVALGMRVTAQVPGPWNSPAEARSRAAGAQDVRCGVAVDVVTDVRGAEFHGVLDTLGGKHVWDACRRVLRPAGQFTTLVGDNAGHGAGSINAHFKSTMRALFAQRVGYQWVSPAADVDGEGADVRDSLGAVVKLAMDGIIRPHVASVMPFERAPSAMKDADGTAVVRIVD